MNNKLLVLISLILMMSLSVNLKAQVNLSKELGSILSDSNIMSHSINFLDFDVDEFSGLKFDSKIIGNYLINCTNRKKAKILRKQKDSMAGYCLMRKFNPNLDSIYIVIDVCEVNYSSIRNDLSFYKYAVLISFSRGSNGLFYFVNKKYVRFYDPVKDYNPN